MVSFYRGGKLRHRDAKCLFQAHKLGSSPGIPSRISSELVEFLHQAPLSVHTLVCVCVCLCVCSRVCGSGHEDR